MVSTKKIYIFNIFFFLIDQPKESSFLWKSPLEIFGPYTIKPQDSKHALYLPKGSYIEVSHGVPSNGGGSRVNRYTIVMDIKLTMNTAKRQIRINSDGFQSLMTVTTSECVRGAIFIDPDGSFFTSFQGDRFRSKPIITHGVYHRIAIIADLPQNNIKIFVNNSLVCNFKLILYHIYVIHMFYLFFFFSNCFPLITKLIFLSLSNNTVTSLYQ